MNAQPTLFDPPAPVPARPSGPRPAVATNDYRLGRMQAAYWSALVSGSPPPGRGEVEVAASLRPCFVREIVEAGLFSRTGIFAGIVPLEDAPRVAAVLRIGGRAVAHALFVPTTVPGAHASPVPHVRGLKCGLIGVYVDEQHRQRGHARACLAAIGEHVRAHAPLREGVPNIVLAESRILRLCGRTFPDVLARRNEDRPAECRGGPEDMKPR